jgi:hypothetical protein
MTSTVVYTGNLTADLFSPEQRKIFAALGVSHDGANKDKDDLTGRLRAYTGPSSSRYLRGGADNEAGYFAPRKEDGTLFEKGDKITPGETKVTVIEGYNALNKAAPSIMSADSPFSSFEKTYLASQAGASGIPKPESKYVKNMANLDGKLAAALLDIEKPEQLEKFAVLYTKHIFALKKEGKAPVYPEQFAALSVEDVASSLHVAKISALEEMESARMLVREEQQTKKNKNGWPKWVYMPGALQAAVNGNYLNTAIDTLAAKLDDVKSLQNKVAHTAGAPMKLAEISG